MKNSIFLIFYIAFCNIYSQNNKLNILIGYDKVTNYAFEQGSISTGGNLILLPALPAGRLSILLDKKIYKNWGIYLETGYTLSRAKSNSALVKDIFKQHQLFLGLSPMYNFKNNIKLGVGLMYSNSFKGDLIATNKNNLSYTITAGYDVKKIGFGLRFTNSITPYSGGENQFYSGYWRVYSLYLKYQFFSF